MRYERPVAKGLAIGKGFAQDARRMRPLRAVPLGLGAVVLAVALSLLATWAHQGGQRAAAETAGQTDLAIAIDVNGDSVDECDTIVATGTGSTCNVVSGTTFGVKELVRFLGAGITDMAPFNGIKEYGGMTWTLNYTAGGLMRVNSGSVQVTGGACPVGPYTGTGGTWSVSDVSGATSFTCHGSSSSFIGAVLRIDFTCNGTGSRTITMKAMPNMSSQTWLHNESSHAQTVSKDSDETLTINCVTPVGGVAELPGIDSNAAQTPSGGGGGWSPIEIAALAAGSVVTLAGAGWFVRRRAHART